MKQILQNMRDGKTSVVELPIPSVKAKTALVQTRNSLVSAGTERMLVEFAEKNLIGKASSRPDLVKQVLNKARREGLLPTIEAAFNKLDQPMSLGYSSAGVVVEVGEGLQGFKPGDRVACAGGGYAVHAEYNLVPQNLLVHLPDNVDFESAAFTTLGAIALQGVRLAAPQVGESVCVIGLGLLGLLTCELVKASGCNLFGIDLAPDRIELAGRMGVKAVLRDGCEDAALAFTHGRGFDQVLICADTSSDDPINLAGLLARDHGTVVAVGVVGLGLIRKNYYEKELDLRVSRSYGPGRYDPAYEESGVDYPFGYVRWTEGRNLQAFADLVGQGKVNLQPLISHRYAIENAPQAYELITGKTSEPFLGVLISYPEKETSDLVRKVEFNRPASPVAKIKLGVLGAGNYAHAVFLPAVKKTGGADLVCVATASGLSASHAAQRFGFKSASSTEADVLENEEINTVLLLTRHQQHARQVVSALEHQKAVYCEKPLALNETELSDIEKALRKKETPLLTVGFNRRFAPLAVKLNEYFQNPAEPLSISYRINAGFLPANHWLHDPLQGGGRIIGEGCHFIDFMTFICGSLPVSVYAQSLPDNGKYHQDNVVMSLRFEDGSIGSMTYLANGNKSFAKERVEVFSGGKIGVLDDFRSLELVNESHRKVVRSRLSQDKGHQAAWQNFIRCVTEGGQPPIPYDQLIAVHKACYAAVKSLASGVEEEL